MTLARLNAKLWLDWYGTIQCFVLFLFSMYAWNCGGTIGVLFGLGT